MAEAAEVGQRLPPRPDKHPDVVMSDIQWDRVIHCLNGGNKEARRLADRIEKRVQWLRAKWGEVDNG